MTHYTCIYYDHQNSFYIRTLFIFNLFCFYIFTNSMNIWNEKMIQLNYAYYHKHYNWPEKLFYGNIKILSYSPLKKSYNSSFVLVRKKHFHYSFSLNVKFAYSANLTKSMNWRNFLGDTNRLRNISIILHYSRMRSL